MRLGSILIGFLLAIGVAYVHDTTVAPRSAEGDAQYIVNWDVLGRSAGEAGGWLRGQIDRLLEQVQRKG